MDNDNTKTTTISTYSTLAGALNPYKRGPPEPTMSMTTVHPENITIRPTTYDPQHHYSTFSTLDGALG